MHVHELRIENFRGIRSFSQVLDQGLNGIIGAGDSGKTTILDALAVLFHPNWLLNLSDNDFYQGDPENNPIRITATVADPPKALTTDKTFFAYLRGIDPTGSHIVDEPDDHTPALTCELTVGSDLEPIWKIICDRHPEGIPLSATNRQKFGVRRIDASDHHLKWVRNSALHQLSEDADGQSTDTVLREVSRQARAAASEKLSPFKSTLDSISTQARTLRAASHKSTFSAELDADLTALTRGSISLHMDQRPVSRTGLGSRRLVTIGVQNLAEAGAHVLLIDELEAGLEPHRTRHLIRYLQRTSGRQVLLTTHSPVVVRELTASQLRIARRTPEPLPPPPAPTDPDDNASTDNEPTKSSDPQDAGGAVTLVTPPDTTQGTIRKHAEGFLSPRVLICEGATEVGFIRVLCNDLEDKNPARMSLIATVDGIGDPQFIEPARHFRQLGYTVGVFCDDDKDTDLTGLKAAGITVLRTAKGLDLEQQVLGTLTPEGIKAVISYAIEEKGAGDKGANSVESVLTNHGVTFEIARALVTNQAITNPPPNLSQLVSIAAGKGGWFKAINRGEDMASLVLDPRFTTMTPALGKYLDELRDWCAPA
ncbi:AAA family ATPase [Rhodococcus qingshengii]|uniref:AAA family ATPase n=1 Tax=Rhodococcus qingshengii TaxID=334542 RepID=A0AAW6LY51_RHOSG|nr:ATP-binding protein [Rhodococcus qingshengii]MDE8650052.1 AAA family ATPase [Rhodococcus qingshengii]